MDKGEAIKRLQEGADRLGIRSSPQVAHNLWKLSEELLRWNRKVNLTAVTSPEEVLEKHLLDSLAIAPEVQGRGTLLDLGSGGGFPGLPLALLLPELRVTLVESVGKKVGFLKHAIATLGLAGSTKAVHLRAEGNPEKEGLERVDAVVARAFAEPGAFARLGRPYLAPEGRLIVMLGRRVELEGLEGVEVESVREYRLPFSGDRRAVAVLRPKT